MYKLENTLRPYAWGSTTAIAELFGREPSGGPEAELWLGAHPDSPSRAMLPDGSSEPLDRLIAENPSAALGPDCVESFGDSLPFLVKVLAADAPLSLQVHPTQEQARRGFQDEEAAGIPRDAGNRNYKDANHKPEMLFALTPFEALCGFRNPSESARLLAEVSEAITGAGAPAPGLLTELIELLDGPLPEPERLERAFGRLINGGDDVGSLVAAAAAALEDHKPGKFALELGTAVELAHQYPDDPGVLISLLLNRLSLQPGEAVYLPAGNIHAYLSGLGVEVMASSDNVLRGGLTPKHVDVPELMKTVEFATAGVPELVAERTGLGQEVYRPPFQEFQLQRIEIPADSASMAADDIPVAQNGPAIVLAVRGSIVLDSPQGDLRLEPGGSAFLPADEAPVMAKLVNDQGSGPSGALAFAVTVSTR